MREISELIVRMAQENRGWGYTRIQGALANLNHRVGRGTIANVLKRCGIEPSPERSKRTPWSTFLRAHWKTLSACDFLTVEVWTGRGLVTHYLLFVMNLADRVVAIAGITTRPGEVWMLQVGRNLTDCESGALHAKEYLIIDRDSKYTAQFRRLIRDNGTKVIRLPPRSPNLNAYAERFVRSIKEECLNRMIFIGQASLRRAVREYIEHYHEERNHQGLGNQLIRLGKAATTDDGDVRRRARVGGLLNFYHRQAV
jgi:putative transposase